jgi:hypothetical protein
MEIEVKSKHTYIEYGNTFLVDEGPIEVVAKTTIELGDKY